MVACKKCGRALGEITSTCECAGAPTNDDLDGLREGLFDHPWLRPAAPDAEPSPLRNNPSQPENVGAEEAPIVSDAVATDDRVERDSPALRETDAELPTPVRSQDVSPIDTLLVESPDSVSPSAMPEASDFYQRLLAEVASDSTPALDDEADGDRAALLIDASISDAESQRDEPSMATIGVHADAPTPATSAPAEGASLTGEASLMNVISPLTQQPADQPLIDPTVDDQTDFAVRLLEDRMDVDREPLVGDPPPVDAAPLGNDESPAMDDPSVDWHHPAVASLPADWSPTAAPDADDQPSGLADEVTDADHPPLRDILPALADATPHPLPKPLADGKPALGVREFALASAAVLIGAVATFTVLKASAPHGAPAATRAAGSTAAAPRAGAATAARHRAATPNHAWNSANRDWVGNDRHAVAFELVAENKVQTWGQVAQPVLVVRCVGHRIESFVFIASAAKLEARDDRHSVHYQMDESPAVDDRWHDSDEHDALFAPDGAAFSRALRSGSTLRFGYTPHNAAPVVAQFSVAGLAEAMAPAAKQCGPSR